MLKKLGFYIKLGIAVILICFLAYPLVIGAVPKSGIKIPNAEQQLFNNVDAELLKIIASQRKLDNLVTKLDDYVRQQGMDEKGNDWAAVMIISYEFKQMSLRHLTSVYLLKQMLYLNKNAFLSYLPKNHALTAEYFPELTSRSIAVIEANYGFIKDSMIIKESKEGVEAVKKVQKHIDKIFSIFFIEK